MGCPLPYPIFEFFTIICEVLFRKFVKQTTIHIIMYQNARKWAIRSYVTERIYAEFCLEKKVCYILLCFKVDRCFLYYLQL